MLTDGIRKLSRFTKKSLYCCGHAAAKLEKKFSPPPLSAPIPDPPPPPPTEISLEELRMRGPGFFTYPIRASSSCGDRGGKLVLFIPSLGNASFFGGTATALIVAGRLAERLGKPLRIVETTRAGNPRNVEGFFTELGIPVLGDEIEIVDLSHRSQGGSDLIDVHPDDDYIASAWWDAHLLNTLGLGRKYVYLLQDFEPIFYANSDRYVLAENTYRTDTYIPICNTRLMYEFMAERYPQIARDGCWFEPAASYRRLIGEKKSNARRKLFIYGRPQVERNLFLHALNAVETAFHEGILEPAEWDLCMAGDDEPLDVVLPCGLVVKNLGKLTILEYERLIVEVDLAVSLMMAPHPNYPTLEFSSAGAAVVTTSYANKVDLSSYSKNIFVADLTHEDIVSKIAEASRLTFDELVENATLSTIPEDWGETLKVAIDRLGCSLEKTHR